MEIFQLSPASCARNWASYENGPHCESVILPFIQTSFWEWNTVLYQRYLCCHRFCCSEAGFTVTLLRRKVTYLILLILFVHLLFRLAKSVPFLNKPNWRFILSRHPRRKSPMINGGIKCNFIRRKVKRMTWVCCWLSSMLRRVFFGLFDYPPFIKTHF